MFEIYKTADFLKEFEKRDSFERERVNQFIKQLSIQGHQVGKELGGRTFFREKKFNGKRLYYLVYLPWNCILLVAMSNKKGQQRTIDGIVHNFEIYKEFIRNLHFKEN